MGLRIHERERLVRDAESKLNGALIDVFKAADLTEGEELRVISSVFGGWLSSIAKFKIREERHGNATTPGGLAKDDDEDEDEDDDG